MLSLAQGCPCLLWLVAVAAAQPGWWQGESPLPPGDQPADPPPVPSALDMSLLQQVVQDPAENQAISPFVMSSLMTQVFLGAAGSTRDEMRPALGLKRDAETGSEPDFLAGYRSAVDYLASNSSNATVAVFNRLYARRGLAVRPSYVDSLRRAYGADTRTIVSPKQTADEINTAVANVTHDKIPELVSAEQLLGAELVLVSALYFRALWRHPFSPAGKGSFLTASGERQVDMMSLSATRLLYANLTTFEAVALPYEDPDYCLLLLRPAGRSMAAVETLLSSLGTLDIADIVSQMFWINVRIEMPKFKIEAEYSLPEHLQALGIREIFSAGADFSDLTDEGGVFVSEVIHKVCLEVTEEGTEAAGAGAVFFTRSMPLRLVLDRPFVAVVYNRPRQLNLFAAYVASPTFDTAPEHDAGVQQQDLPRPRGLLERVPMLKTVMSDGRFPFHKLMPSRFNWLSDPTE